MRLPVIRLVWLLVFFSLGLSEAHADSDSMPKYWTVMEASGGVNIKATSGLELSTQAGTKLDPPFTILTGANGRAVITHGQDKLTVSPNSKSTVPEPAGTGQITRIQQALGSVLYHVQHRITDRFEVDTPYLVSVVKGTTFNINVTSDASTVALIEGRLQVYTPDKKFELILKPGQAATKSRQNEGIILSDQQSLSNLKQGPITILKDGESPLTAKPGIPTHTIPGSKSESNDGVNVPGASAKTSIGGSALSFDANSGGMPADTGISGGKALNVDTNVGGMPAGTSIGGSALQVDANAGGMSADKIISGGSALNAAVSIPFPTTVSGVVGNTLTIITPESASLIKKEHPQVPKH